MLLEIIVLPRTNPTGRGLPPRELRLQCDVCNNEFRKTYHKLLVEAKKHSCCLKCAQQRPKKNDVELVCEQCSKKFTRYKKNADASEKHFCEYRCYWNWRSAHPEAIASWLKSGHTPEAIAKSAASNRDRCGADGYVHTWTGRSHTQATVEKIRTNRQQNPLSGDKNGMFGKHHSEEAREKMSKIRTANMLAGKVKPYGNNNHVQGTYVSIKSNITLHYRSSWELAFMKFLDSSPHVTKWEFESLRISYNYRNHKRWYIPDFVVFYADAKFIYEIKPKEFIHNERVESKSFAACQYAHENEMNFDILTKEKLEAMGVL